MKIKQFLNEFIALTLVITIVFSIFTVSASAVTNDKNASSQNANIQNNLTVQGTNSVGTMLASEIEEKNEETEENNGCNVFSVEVTGNEAAVSFETVVDATLLVAVYNESCDTLITTGTTEVEKGETEKNVTFDTEEMPQYFYLKGYLIDTETNKPLCTAYSSPMYTKEMQEFLAKTTDDFDEDKVLNFDNEKDNNFAVYKENVKLVDDSSDKNKVTKSDDTTKTYVIENIDESISSLKEGDIFSYNYSEGNALVVKIATITIDGTTATITGADMEIEDVFDYVKIDSTVKKADYTYDDEEISDGLTPIKQQSRALTRAKLESENTMSYSLYDNSPKEGVEIKGTLDLSLTTSAKLYLKGKNKVIEIINAQSLGLKVELSVKGKKEYILGEFTASPTAGLTVTLTPKLVVEGSVKVSVNASLKSQVGFSWTSKGGFKNESKSPKFDFDVKLEGSLFMGVKLTMDLKFIHGVLKGEVSALSGIEYKLEDDSYTDTDSKKHPCLTCNKGEFSLKREISADLKFLGKKLGAEFKRTGSVKLSDIYYCVEHNKFEYSTCPYIKYKVTVVVKDKNGNLIKDAQVNGSQRTDENGTAIFYFPNGKNEICVVINSQKVKKNITVDGKPISINIPIDLSKPGSGSSESDEDKDNPIIKKELKIKKVVAGPNHTAAITEDKSLYMWGDNTFGQLGDGTNIDRTTPVKVMENIDSVCVGENFSLALTTDGILYAWGANHWSQLGIDSTIEYKCTPTKTMDNVKAITLNYHSCAAITTNNDLYMWGANYCGQIGIDSQGRDVSKPTKILENIKYVDLGNYSYTERSAAITNDGILYMWGFYKDGSNREFKTPQKIMNNVIDVSMGQGHNAVITTDGSLYTWGYNACGQLGNGTSTSGCVPEKVMDNIEYINLGSSYSAVITKNKELYMFGNSSNGECGIGSEISDHINNSEIHTPMKILDNVIFETNSILYNGHVAAIKQDKSLYMWGDNRCGEVGNDTFANIVTVPAKIMNNVKSVSLGYHHSAAITIDGELYMWGNNSYGQLGDGTKVNRSTPVKVLIKESLVAVSDTKILTESVGASSTQRTAKFTGYSANGIYNFYSVKDKNADKLLTDDNILYVDQVRADANGNINVTYNAKADCISPYEFVASITQIDIGNAEVTAESLTYNGKMQTVEPVVKVNGYTLYSGIDYELTGAYEAKNAGEYTYTIIGKGDFVGYTTKTFTINPADVNTCDASSISAKTYTGTEIQPDVELTMDNDTLKKDVDYTVEYQNNVNAGIGIVVIKGMGNYSGRKVCWFDITKCDVSKINITIPICTYYGDTVIPEMFIENNGVALVKDKDYTVTFKNNDSVGTATAVITGIGNYSGTVEKKFQIREPFGDVDMNGKIDVNDVTIIMAYNVELMNLSSEQLKFADVNEDGYVDVSDATLIQQYIADCI